MGGCPDDILDWYEAMGLTRRKNALKKNVSVATADAVLVAEAIHYYYPKIVQLHSYVEQHNVSGRISNWKHLNTKVLRVLHFELSDDQMMRFASRQSDEEVVDFLRELRIKIPSFEPLYLAEFHMINDPTSQKMSMDRMMRAVPQRSYSMMSDNSSIVTASSMVESSSADSHLAAPSPPKPVGTNLTRAPTQKVPGGKVRRPSALQSNKILEARREREEVARRASMMTSADLDIQFQQLAAKLKKDTVQFSTVTDELDRRSQTLDAHMAALQKQNATELAKTERRLSVLRLELLEAETGQSVAIDDDLNYSAMTDISKNAFAKALSENLKEVARQASSYEDAVAAKLGGGRNGSISTPSKAENNVPFGGMGSVPSSANRAAFQPGTAKDNNELYYEEEENSTLASDEEYETDDSDETPPPPPPPLPRTAAVAVAEIGKDVPSITNSRAVGKNVSDVSVQRGSATITNELQPAKSTVPAEKSASQPTNLANLAHIPPSAPQSSKPLKSILVDADSRKHEDHHIHFSSRNEEYDTDDEDAAFEALSAMKSASARIRVASDDATDHVNNAGSSKSQSAPAPTHRRCFDKAKNRFYYVDLKTGESKWRAPTEGLVVCLDKENREYLFDVVTEKSTWVKR